MNTRHHYLRLLRTFALAALTAAATAACSDDTDNGSEPLTPPDGNGGIPVAFTANINPGSDANPAGAPGTRTVLHPTDNGGFTVTWKGKDNNAVNLCDEIIIWAVKETNVIRKYYVPSYSAVSSPLEPWDEQNKLILTEPGEWKFTAFCAAHTSPDDNQPYSLLSAQNQTGPNNTEHIARWDFSVATAKQHIAEAGNEMPQVIDFRFKHMLSALQLHVTNETGAELTVKEIRLALAEEQITCQRTYDIAAENWKTGTEQKSDCLRLAISNSAALASGATDPQKFHMLLFPGCAGKSMTITVITDRGEYTLKKPAPTDGFKAGTNYTTEITIRNDNLNPSTETWRETIRTAEELAAFCNRVNDGTDNYAGKTIYLVDDITLSGNWEPIGTDSKPFSGTFDGEGHSISGLNVNTTEKYAGLFGYVSGGTVRNLRVSGTVTTTDNYSGGIAGFLSGRVENCIFSGNVSGKGWVGGIAGGNEGNNSQIAGCYTKGNVTATGNYAGGIAGNNSTNNTITDCYSEAGTNATSGGEGIVGSSYGAVARCYATGQVHGKQSVGGIIGYQANGSITNCIALNPSLIRTEGNATYFGRVVGYKSGGTVTNCGAFTSMTIKGTNGSSFDGTGEAGTTLTREQCLTEATYTSTYGFTEATANANGWAFNSGTTWTYLPWNKAFENFSGITETGYRISVPNHLNSTN